MALSDFSIRRPVFAWMLFFGLILFGYISFRGMGVSQLPDVDFPVVSIGLHLDGAAPEIMETEAVDAIESSMMSIQGVRTITSSSRNSAASITVEFDLNKNIDVAMQEVQNRISQIQAQLPPDLDPPSIAKTNPEDQPIMWLTVESEKMSRKDLMAYVRDELKDRFSTVNGVGDIMMGGYVDPNLRVWLSADKLRTYALAANDVINAIKNQHAEAPGGYIETPTKEYNVRTMGEAANLQEFENLVINQRGGVPNYMPIKLKQVGRVEEGLADIRQVSRTQGRTAVGLGIRKQRGSNAVDVARGVFKRMADLKTTLPAGINLAPVFDSTKFIEEAVHELNFELFLSALLTGVVCWLFLGSISSTVNILLAIPTSIVGAFTALYFLGFTLNSFTLLALTLAIGIVVDDAIMMLENIVRHREMGKSRLRGAIDGAREITPAAVITTIAIVAIFLPVVFMKGIIGKFFFQFGIAMTVTVLLSLLEALTITPMRCAEFLDTSARTTWIGRFVEHSLGRVTAGYKRSLGWALNARWLVVGLALAFFAVSLSLSKFLNKEFMPAQDQSRFMVRIQTPVGSSLEFTDGKMKEVEKFLLAHPAIERFYVSLGGFGGGEVNAGMAFITMKPKGERPVNPETHKRYTQGDMMAICRKEFNKILDVKAMIQDLSARGFTASRGFPVEFTILGPDWDKLGGYSELLMKKLTDANLVTDIDSDYKLGMPEIHVVPDRDAAAVRGVSISAIGQTVNALIGGVIGGKYTKNAHRYDIRVRLESDERTKAEQINSLSVRNNYGELVPLSALVKLEEKATLQAVARRDRQRAITVFSNVAAGKSQEAVLQTVEKLGKELLPDGYRIVTSGSAQTFRESFQSLIVALVLGIFVAYMVLASQFNSFIHPITVLMALPFSISGAFVALLIAHQSLNIYSMIGLILLMGIAKKNSILLVEFTNQTRERNLHERGGSSHGSVRETVRAALLYACPIRLRPILMTSFAMIAGTLPVALSFGPGSETSIPMAVTVIGGLIASTILTLYVVPCIYSLFARLERKKPAVDESLETQSA